MDLLQARMTWRQAARPTSRDSFAALSLSTTAMRISASSSERLRLTRYNSQLREPLEGVVLNSDVVFGNAVLGHEASSHATSSHATSTFALGNLQSTGL